MKHALFLILDHGELVDSIFKDLSDKKFNATVLEARSIKHLLEDEESDDIHFLNIGHLERKNFPNSTFCYFIVDEKKLDTLKKTILKSTDHFKKIKGGMFSVKLEDFVGSI